MMASRASSTSSRLLFNVFSTLIVLLCGCATEAATSGNNSRQRSLQDLDYRIFPRRTSQEAAVLEWGNSAILTALDVSVAHFGPQTSDAALLEVDTTPVLADPLDGVLTNKRKQQKPKKKKKQRDDEGTLDEQQDGGANNETEEEDDEDDDEDDDSPLLGPLDNADEVLGNMCIMTNTGNLSGVQMAKIAQASGAAALLVVNSNGERQDDIYRLPVVEGQGAEEIDIPVVMISLNSANMLATALLDPDKPMSADDESESDRLTNKYMPHRVRLYAGDDRPFFEDVEMASPTVYLIHDLLKAQECDALIARAKAAGLKRVTHNDGLQYTMDADKLHNVERVTLWQGLLTTPARKLVEERIEQVTAFPSNHFSDFVVDRLSKGSHYKPRYDVFSGGRVPVASMTIFLSNAQQGGELVYPSTSTGDAIKIVPKKGMVVVHHNTDEQGNFEMASLHALLPATVSASSSSSSDGDDGFYVAHKYIFMDPLSNAHRVALPVFAAPFGGRLPDIIVTIHDLLTEQFGHEQGSFYFEKLCIFVPMLIIFTIVSAILNFIRKRLFATPVTTTDPSTATTAASNKMPQSSPSAIKKRKKKD
jgi:PA domain